ncbi:MAG: TRM11 family methyltransferase [Sulfolobales archaeon]|nr:TRM11 family methyltransferase [Sulfolobales archaeon]MCX8186267.1 TRM11 family methyltransferase [Sulfolobales archaeon]MDW7968997.1 TRM11 family methyltransferase [Sulfolobales archaeon]
MEELKKYYIVLSGEHRTLPISELRSIALTEGLSYRELANLDMVVLSESSDKLTTYVARAALTKVLGEVITLSESDDNLLNIVRNVDWDNTLLGVDTYTVDLIRIKEYSKWISYESIIDLIKPLIPKKFVPLSKAFKSVKQPTIIDFILTDGLLIVGKRHYEREFSTFSSKDPKNRPAYRPGTMKSVMSRVLVNLSRVSVKRGETYLDPFCGVGGLLIEACAIGLKYVGSDIDRKCVEGAKNNLIHFNCIPSVIAADACNLPYRSVDGVGTDPPYGRLSRGKGRESIQELMECTINCLADIIKKGGYLALAQSKEIALEDVLDSAGFELVEKHYNWLHRSLVRNIYVAVRR